MHTDITGVVLAGGQSRRMGLNKSLLPLGPTTVIERITRLMQSLFSRVLLSTNSPEEYLFLGLDCIADELENIGPLAGIHAGLVRSATPKVFVISCDVPLMRADIIEFLIAYPTARPITVASADGFIQQLCGVYSQAVLPDLERIFQTALGHCRQEGKQRCPVLELVHAVQAEIIDIESVYRDYRKGAFYNMNNRQDYQYIQTLSLAPND